MSRSVVVGLVVIATVAGVRVASAELLTDAYLERVHTAFAHMYNLDYAESVASFEALRDDYPNHPGPHLDLAIVVWQRELFRRRELKLDRFAAPSYFTEPTETEMPASELRAFRSHIDAAETLADSRLSTNPDDPDGLYYLGAVQGIRASFALTIERDKLKALRLGRRAHNLHQRLVELDRGYIDAYLTLGTYQYIADNLPWYVKWIAALIGFRGDEERGLDFLEAVADRGRRSRNVARVLRMVLLVREDELEDALATAQGLGEDFPRNYLFALNEVQVLEELRRTDEAVARYRYILQKIDDGEPNYQLAPEPELRLRIAEKLSSHGCYEISRQTFHSVLEHANASPSQKARAELGLGAIHEHEGRSEEARRHYRRVLALDASHELPDEVRDRAEEATER